MKVLILVAVISSTAFAVTPAVWCRANNVAGTKWWYSAVFPQADGKSAKDYADDWKAWLDGQIANGQLQGFSGSDKLGEAQCHAEPHGDYYAKSQEQRDEANHNDRSRMLAAANVEWDPRASKMWCVWIRVKTDYFTRLFDENRDKSFVEAEFDGYMKKKEGVESHSICHPYKDQTEAEIERKKAMIEDEQHGYTPKEIDWTPND